MFGKILQHKLITLVIFLYLLQFFLILNKRIVYDECWVAVPVYQFFENGGFWVNAVHNVNQSTSTYQFTNYQVLLLLFHFIVPDSIIYSRMINVIIVPAIMIVVYILGLRIFRDKRWAVIPALMLAADNIFFITSFIVRPDIILALGVTIVFLLLYDREGRFQTKNLFIAGIICGIITGMHPNFLIFIASFLFAFVIHEARNFRTKENLISLAKFLSGVLILIIPIVIYILVSQKDYQTKIITYIFSYVQKTTNINEENSILNPVNLLIEEGRRYKEFLQGTTRIHLLIIFIGTIIFTLKSREKMIRIMSLSSLVVLILFTLLLANKNVRYLTMILPITSLLTTWLLFKLNTRFISGFKKYVIPAILILLFSSSLVGNFYFIIKRWDTNYNQLRNKLYFDFNKETTILGDLVFWDIYKGANFISFMSQYDFIKKQKFDYIITGGKPTIQDKTRNSFIANIFPKLNKRFIKEYKNSYYGNFKVYKILH